MTVPAISAISATLPTVGVAAPTDVAGAGATGSTGSDFASMLEKGINAVQSSQDKADSLSIQAATGDLTDIHDYTIAATQASLVTELATTIRTKGIDAFNQIMGMQA
ncbi:MAG: flagellar hook-basal body complex protein FliE [Actinomycetota bacterium]|nr:flagellar hook-basal body complex protein FliE [Actinomycetota bacterium]